MIWYYLNNFDFTLYQYWNYFKSIWISLYINFDITFYQFRYYFISISIFLYIWSDVAPYQFSIHNSFSFFDIFPSLLEKNWLNIVLHKKILIEIYVISYKGRNIKYFFICIKQSEFLVSFIPIRTERGFVIHSKTPIF